MLKLYKQRLILLLSFSVVMLSFGRVMAADFPQFSLTDLDSLHDENKQPIPICEVDEAGWDLVPSDRTHLTLSRAAIHFNSPASKALNTCTEGIDLLTNVVAWGPLGLLRDGAWVLDGKDHKINFSEIDAHIGQAIRNEPLAQVEGKLCAIVIKASNVTVKNLTVTGVPSDWNGICFFGTNNRLENVRVEVAGTGSAVLFGNVANSNVVDKMSSVSVGNGAGVEYNIVDGPSFTTNIVELFKVGENVEAVDGVVKHAEGDEGFVVSGSNLSVFFKNTKQDLKVLIERAGVGDQADKFLFQGCVVQENADGSRNSAGNFLFQLPANVGFERFVLFPQFGNQLGAPSEVILSEPNEFSSNAVDCSTYPRTQSLDTQFSGLQIYPEKTGNAASTSIYGLVVTAGDDDEYGIYPASRDGDGGGDYIPGPGVSAAQERGIYGVARGFKDMNDCLCKRRIQGHVGLSCDRVSSRELRDYDTDGDGKRDDDEDANKDCVVDARETDWNNPDSDGDGLLDNVAFEKSCTNPQGEVGCGAQFVGATLNGRNPDVDGDTLLDGEEDRNFYYPLYRKENQTHEAAGYLYLFDSSSLKNIPITYLAPDPTDASGARMIPTPRDCPLKGDAYKIGVGYERWVLRINKLGQVIDEPRPLGTSAPTEPILEGDNETLDVTVLLACRSEIFRSDITVFDGKFDARSLETNLASTDTDNDQVLDQSDKCPTLSDNNVTADGDPVGTGCPVGGKVADCTDNMVYFGVDRRFVRFENDYFTPIGLRDDDLNDIADVLEPLQLVKSNILVEADLKDLKKVADAMGRMAAGDLDQDGIKDVVESQVANESANNTRLSFCDRDSDDDGLIDGPGIGVQEGALSDVCPQDKGGDVDANGISQQDLYSDDVNHRYSCGARDEALENVYGTDFSRALAYFLDRDNDGLMDAQEDSNLNGVAELKKIHEIRIGKAIKDGIIRDIRLDKGLESHPLMRDTDSDGLDDHFEWTTEIIQNTDSEGNSVSYFTNPGDSDSDGDQLADLAEITRDGNPEIHVDIDKRDGGCAATKEKDTDPTNPDTDFDGLLDGSEDSGILYAAPGEILSDLLKNPTFFQGNEDARRLYSSPVDKHSDGDGLTDAEEYNIVFEEGMKPQAVPALTRTMTNPCEGDTDGDSQDDNFDAEKGQCGTFGGDNAESCIPIEDEQALGGQDQDGDSLSDARERILGTDINNPDSDLDGLWDGQEDCNRNGRGIGVEMCDWTGFRETDPLLADTDGDGLNDNLEVSFGGGSSPVVVAGVSETTDPTNPDSDGDGIPDGPGGLVAGPNGEPVQSLGEDANGNGRYDTGETDPRNPDTDGDGLADGLIGGLGEDFNRNGIVDKDAKGRLLETDPRVPDTDFDGRPDGDEAMRNGRFNISRATNYNDGGCSLVTNGQGSMPAAVSFFFGLVMLATTTVRRKVKNAVSKAA